MSYRNYVVHWTWSWDHSNDEFHVFTVEKGSETHTIVGMDNDAKRYAKEYFEETCPCHGSRELLGLYLAGSVSLMPECNGERTLKASGLKLIHDFTKEQDDEVEGKPVLRARTPSGKYR